MIVISLPCKMTCLVSSQNFFRDPRAFSGLLKHGTAQHFQYSRPLHFREKNSLTPKSSPPLVSVSSAGTPSSLGFCFFVSSDRHPLSSPLVSCSLPIPLCRKIWYASRIFSSSYPYKPVFSARKDHRRFLFFLSRRTCRPGTEAFMKIPFPSLHLSCGPGAVGVFFCLCDRTCGESFFPLRRKSFFSPLERNFFGPLTGF